MGLPSDPGSVEELITEILRVTSGSGEELAAEVGVSYASLYAWSRGRRRPSRANAAALAEVAARRARRLSDLAERLLTQQVAPGAISEEGPLVQLPPPFPETPPQALEQTREGAT